MEFQELKQDILNKAKEAKACEDEYKRAYKSNKIFYKKSRFEIVQAE